MLDIKRITEAVYSMYGKDGLAFYLQGSGGACIACGCQTPPHKDDCKFVKYAKEILEKEDK